MAPPPDHALVTITEQHRDSIVRYRRWLERRSIDSLKQFLNRLGSGVPQTVEGALGEAVAWNWLAPRCERISLYEVPGTGGPDFLCESSGERFLVEVTTITRETTTRRSGLSESPDQRFGTYGSIMRAIKKKADKKAAQVAGYELPVLVFVVTLHYQASVLCLSCLHVEQLLIGSTGFGITIDAKRGEAVGKPYSTAALDHPVFFGEGTTTPARRHISGILLGGFGLVPPKCVVKGVVHPDPVRPIDIACLPDLRWCMLEPWPSIDGTLGVTWRYGNGAPADDATVRAAVSARQRAEVMRTERGRTLLEYLDRRASAGDLLG